MASISHYVGLDVHKDSIAIAVAEAKGGEPRSLGVIINDWPRLKRKLLKIANAASLTVCYEAGPSGYVLHRQLEQAGIVSAVVAPSRVPKQAADQVKTDRRDALALARYLRSGDLTPISVPDEQTEAIRDLTRARIDAKEAERTARQQLNFFLLRRGHPYRGTRWTKKHIEWINKIRFDEEASYRVVTDNLRAVEVATQRVAQLTQDITDMVDDEWQYKTLVKSYMALRGVQLVTAATLAAELGDVRRFPDAAHLMSFVGLVPSEHTSGASRRRGRITRAGNTEVRRVLVESAWAYRFRPRMSPAIRARNENLPEPIRDISWKAQKRLCNKYYKMNRKGKPQNQIAVAIARELAGFVWSIGQTVLAHKRMPQ